MRRSLVWTLSVVLCLSALAWWLPPRARSVVNALPARPPEPLLGAASTNGPMAMAPLRRAALPPTLEPLTLEPARRDPFAQSPLPAAPALAEAAAAPAVAAPPPPPPPPPPTAPPLHWRLFGTMRSPAGESLVLLVNTSTPSAWVVAQSGLSLEGGYQIQAVSDTAVRLVYPPLQTEVEISIPAPAPHLVRAAQ